MAKTGSQGLFVEKGEKIGLGIAVGIGVLFLALGVMALVGRSQDPEAFAKNVDGKAADLNSKMNSPTAMIDPIDQGSRSRHPISRCNWQRTGSRTSIRQPRLTAGGSRRWS